MRLILGSASPGRRKYAKILAEELGANLEIVSSDIDEKAIRDSDPQTLVRKLSEAKANALLPTLSDQESLLITADQVVTWNDEIREKPRNAEEGRQFLQDYANSRVQILSGVRVTNLATGAAMDGVHIATVTFGDIPDAVIEDLVSEGSCLGCAGGLKAEDPRMLPYETKSDLQEDHARGLPLALTKGLIQRVLG